MEVGAGINPEFLADLVEGLGDEGLLDEGLLDAGELEEEPHEPGPAAA